MPKVVCDYAVYYGEQIKCKITNQPCGNVKFCRMEGRWKLNDYAINCPIPKKVRSK